MGIVQIGAPRSMAFEMEADAGVKDQQDGNILLTVEQ